MEFVSIPLYILILDLCVSRVKCRQSINEARNFALVLLDI